MYQIPDAAVATLAEQARLKSGHFDALARGIDGQGVVSGCAVTAPGGTMTVAVAAGVVQGVTPAITHEVQAQTLTIGAASGSMRIDLVVVSTTTGIASITAGTAGTTPLFPAVAAGSVLLAAVYVDTTTTSIATGNIIDMRVNTLTTSWVNVRDYGARGDVRKYSDGVATASSTSFTSATATFTQADKGKTITIGGAGTAGALHTTTIASVTNGTTIVLTAAAITTKNPAIFGFGTDDTTAISNAVDAMNARGVLGGGVVFFPPGMYGMASGLLAKDYVVLRGAGEDISTIYQLGTGYVLFDEPNGTVPSVAGTFFGAEDITFWGAGDRYPVQDGGATSGRLLRMRSEKVWVRRVHATYARQMSITGVGSIEARAENCLVENGLRDGINFTGSQKAIYVGNTILRCSDDAIAFHVEANLAINTVRSPQFVCIGNRIEHGSGIKFLGGTNAVVVGNTGRFLLGYGTYTDFDATFGEGNKDTIGVVISGNSFMDLINLTAVGGGDLACGIYVASPAPDKGTGATKTVTTAGTVTVTCATAATTDIGRTIKIPGAGTAGALYTGEIINAVTNSSFTVRVAPPTNVTGVTATLSSLTYYPSLATAGTGTAAIKGPSANAWNGMSGPATGGYGLVITNNVVMNTLDGSFLTGTAPTAATTATKFSDYGFGNTWWTAGARDLTSWAGNVYGATALNTNGIQLVSGAQQHALIAGNQFYGLYRGVLVQTAPVQPSVIIRDNSFIRMARGISLEMTVDTYGDWIVEGNYFDLDPLFESSERTAGPTGTWTRAAGNTAVCVYSFQAHGVHFVRNTVRNTCNLTTGNTEDVVVHDNLIFANMATTAPSYGGVGLTDKELVQSRIVQYDSDPRSITYMQIKAGYNYSGTAMPAAGTWAKGTFVKNETPAVTNGVVTMGWLRLTSGTGNVENTDWAVIGSLMKTNSTSTPTAAAGSSAGTTPPAPVVTAGSSALRGRITFGTGSGSPGTADYVTVTFGTAYATAPYTVMVTASNQATAVKQPYLQTVPSTTAFKIGLGVAGAASQANTVYSVDYLVIP
jgi:hypothetical protein